ncbi:zinc finger protein 318 isoform 3-T3 [Leptodactylus fuscus]|uniref:zinc finger protein 318 isoform X3 n=1 Tax=Leptodactylus fuscus TaxID=238119 RepID=UPI003F4E80AC
MRAEISSSGVKSSQHVYQSSSEAQTTPLPMPMKSILKKRPEVEPSSGDQSPQVDKFSSNKDVINVSSAGAGTSVEKNSLTTECQRLSSQSTLANMGLLKASSSNSSAPATAQNPESTSWMLSSSSEIGLKGILMGKNPPSGEINSPTVTQYSAALDNYLFNKSAPKSPATPFSNVFPEHKDAARKGPGEAGGFFLLHEQDCKSSPLSSKPLSPKQRSSSEIEDEERFLYGDEEEKKPEPQKTQTGQIASAPPAKSSPNKQEFEKIHDLLKTIGLDIGVAEIGKLAVRTQERLHGKKAVPKMSKPAAERPQSAATMSPTDSKAKIPKPEVKTEKKEKEEAKSAAKTEPPVQLTTKELTPPVTQPSPSPSIKEKPQLILQKTLSKETPAVPKVEIPVQPPTPSPIPDPTPPPVSPAQIPMYPQYPHPPMVPAYNMPPPGYNPYSPYVSYPTSGWPMYPPMPPPPSPMPPPPSPTPMPTPPLPHINVPVSSPAPVYHPRSNLRIIETTEVIPDAKADAKPMTPLAALLAKQEADRKNKEAEKLKVLDELDSVRKDHKVKSESLKTLSAKVEQLRIQQGKCNNVHRESVMRSIYILPLVHFMTADNSLSCLPIGILLRKKRREKDGHKDPLLEELNNVLESAQKQIHSLSEEINTTKQKQQQLTKVAEILGVSPTELAQKSEPKKETSPGSRSPARDSDNELGTGNDESKSANDLKASSNAVSKSDGKYKSGPISGADTKLSGAAHLSIIPEKSEDVKCKGSPPVPCPDPKSSPEPHSPYLSKSEDTLKSRDKSRSKSPRPCIPSSKIPPKSEEPPPFDISQIFEYYDSGSHWCEDCNAICMTLPEFLLHLHDKSHIQCVKEVKRPWLKRKVQDSGSTKKQKVNVPLKGPEFLLPVNGYYCELCEEVFPDHIVTEEHLRAYAHNDKYKKYMDAHVNYEIIRREKKKAKLIAAQEESRRQADQKRKQAEQKHESYEHSKSKKAKKEEQEEERKAKTSKPHTSPPSSDQRRNKTPEKETAKSPSFGKFAWKPSENKTQAAVSSSIVEPASNKPKEEEPITFSFKPKGFAMKFLGKPNTLPGNALSAFHSAASPTVTSTTASSTTASSTTASSTTASSTTASSTTASLTTASSTTASSPITTTQTKVQSGLPSLMNIRPNLPSLMTIRPVTPLATMNKPAPLNTFLSIKSSNGMSKAVPAVNNKPTGVFPEDLVSKAFEGEVVLLKESTQPDSPNKNENKVHEKTAAQSPLQAAKGQDLLNVLVSKKETGENQEVKSDKESSDSKQPTTSFPQKFGLDPGTTSQTTYSGPSKPAQSPGSANIQQKQTTKSSGPNPKSSGPNPTKSSGPNPTLSQGSGKGSAKPSVITIPKIKFSSAKLDSTFKPIKSQTSKDELSSKKESGVQKPEEAKAPSNSEKETAQEVKSFTLLMNPATGRLAYLPVQETKDKDTNVQKLPETKPKPTTVTYVSSVKPNNTPSTPLAPVPKIKPTFNATTKLNQKFKKAPISLPSSLFGHVQDAACKDIKITSESHNTNNRTEKSGSALLAQKPVSFSLSAKPSPAKPNTMEKELDSYYKLIASEDDPEDLTTSEDQDSEAVPVPTSVTTAPLETKVESPPEKKVKVESAPPPVKTVKAVVPEVSSEDIDDSDMACEVPDVPFSSVSQVSGWNVMPTSYASNQFHDGSNWKPLGLESGNISINKDYLKETQVTPVTATETSMEDLSVCVTCDSD